MCSTPASPEITDDHLRMARAIAAQHWRRCPGCSVTLSEFRAVAYYGLAVARAAYDPASGAGFPHYARIRISGAIRDYLRSLDPLTRTERARLTPEDLLPRLFVPLEEAYGLAAAEGLAAEEAIDQASSLLRLADALAGLTPRERQVIQMVDLAECRVIDVARSLGIADTTVSVTRKNALRRLRGLLGASPFADDRRLASREPHTD